MSSVGETLPWRRSVGGAAGAIQRVSDGVPPFLAQAGQHTPVMRAELKPVPEVKFCEAGDILVAGVIVRS